jgi:hypothetical protein
MVEIYLEDDYFSFLKEVKPTKSMEELEKYERKNDDLITK